MWCDNVKHLLLSMKAVGWFLFVLLVEMMLFDYGGYASLFFVWLINLFNVDWLLSLPVGIVFILIAFLLLCLFNELSRSNYFRCGCVIFSTVFVSFFPLILAYFWLYK